MAGNKVTEWKVDGEPTEEDIEKAAAELNLAMVELIYSSMRHDYEKKYSLPPLPEE